MNKILDSQGFDRFVEERCRKFYADKTGRPSLVPPIDAVSQVGGITTASKEPAQDIKHINVAVGQMDQVPRLPQPSE